VGIFILIFILSSQWIGAAGFILGVVVFESWFYFQRQRLATFPQDSSKETLNNPLE
jgi:hypothetical protein